VVLGSAQQAFGLRLRQAAEAELKRGPSLGFREPVRRLIESQRAAPRAQELNRFCLTGVLAYLALVVAINAAVVAEPSWPDVALQCTVTPLLTLSIGYFAFRPDRDATAREFGALGVSCCFSLATLVAITGGPALTAIPNFFLVSLPVIGVLFFARLRFFAALAFVAVTAVALALALLGRPDLPAALRGYPFCFLLAAAVPALLGVFRLERASRETCLTALIQSLRIEELAFENGQLNLLSTTDAVTGAANRRQLETVLRLMCAEPPHGDFLLLADIDFFKSFNDRFGHLAGDECLREVTATMRAELRRTDLLARFGGEEFAIVLSRCTKDDALATAERIRSSLARHVIMANGAGETVTVSIGVAERLDGASAEQLIAAADNALYAAKNAGRNRVCCSGAELDTVT
jgi:diguanylate cyclase (GGDEF)-like protein